MALLKASTSYNVMLQVSEQLVEQQQAAADQAAGLEAEVSQLQQQLLNAQRESEETQTAAKLKQSQQEDHAQALAQVTFLLFRLPASVLHVCSCLHMLTMLQPSSQSS